MNFRFLKFKKFRSSRKKYDFVALEKFPSRLKIKNTFRHFMNEVWNSKESIKRKKVSERFAVEWLW